MDPITNGVIFEAIKEIGKNIIKSNDENSQKTQKVKLECNCDSYSLTDVYRGTTNQRKINKKNPNIIIENPLNTSDSIIHEISLVPSKDNKEKMRVLITVEDVPIFRTRTAGAFTDIFEIVVKIQNGKSLRQDKPMKIYFWNDTDDSEVSLTAQVTFGE